ncbi:G-protein alpha subunit-domain-containing protein [Russula dissimulans]|nr:G-protein alpha subunit-domain-containing protein [Russula dissimulans]
MVVRQQRQQEVPVDPDPLLWAWGPPANETPSQRAVREVEEKAARLISDRIDEEMRKEKIAIEGEIEFRELEPIWRAVVRLNLVRSVNKILDALGKAHRAPHVDKLRKRLSPLHRAQRDLEKHLGLTEGEEMRATAIPQLVQQVQLEKAMKVVISSRDDITVLWGDDSVRAVLDARILLNEHSRLYQDYEPSDDDVSRVRSRTVSGVQECNYLLDADPDAGPRSQWVFYDVNYPRTEGRVSWIPYLMEANALVFLASLSTFDQFLEDDPRINRLGDTYRLWTVICGSRLISKMHLILILSGCVRLKRYITSYGDRPNDLTSATECTLIWTSV